MNIKRAKQEIINTVKAYLKEDDNGNPIIPVMRQRPILLIGPPGIGKTAVIEQAARECNVGVAAYTMTHHTRQSAMGLPFIEKKEFDGEQYSVTSYTMSEIIASVHEKIASTGLKSGILFIDEINCVSETLSPVMLQFLQAKTFGNAKVPEGWVIVAAGNPPEYNRSVRAFDVVTLDRVKLINIEPEYSVWKEYAIKNSIHQAIISYLDAKRENFYKIETTIDGKQFVTARGWEDLSDMIKAYEIMGLDMDSQVVGQYLQQPDTAIDFANYLSLYYKYEKTYSAEDILNKKVSDIVKNRLKEALFDEKIIVVSLILSSLNVRFKEFYTCDKVTEAVYQLLKYYQKNIETDYDRLLEGYKKLYNQKLAGGLLDVLNKEIMQKSVNLLEDWKLVLREEKISGHMEVFERLAQEFSELTAERDLIIEKSSMCLENSFDFLEEVFVTGPELVLFVTELAAGFFSLNFIQENGCERFYKYNKNMIRDNVREELAAQIDELV